MRQTPEDSLFSDMLTAQDIADIKSLKGPILVVGASGFIGAKLFHSIRNVRGDVFACSRFPQHGWRLQSAPKSSLVSMDVTDADSVKRTLSMLRPRTVFNLSSYGAYARQNNAELIHATNYTGTFHLIKTLSETGCDAFVQAGSSSEYGLNCKGPGETGELVPNSDYAVSKAGAGYLLKYYGKIHQFPGVNLRLYSIYGPWEESDRLITTLLNNCIDGRLPNFVAKSISRDFVYIDDCITAFVKTALGPCVTAPGISINIATGVRTTIEEVAGISKEMFGIKEEPHFGSMPNRKWDVCDWYGDNKLAKELLGWAPKTAFRDGLLLTARWIKLARSRPSLISPVLGQEKISAIVACYKDALSIPVLHRRLTDALRNSGYDYEIIFVNDSSPDNDEEVITRLSEKDSHVVGISHSRNFGSQSAFLSGMELATGDAVVLMDGDGQDPPELIADFIREWKNGCDIVYGERVKREAPLHMQLLYKLFYRIFRNLADISIPLDAGDFSLISKRAVNQLLNFSEKDIFLRGLRAWIGFRQKGVPYSRPERLFGKSTNSFAKNIMWAKKAVFSFSTKPLHYIQAIGALTFVATLALLAFYLAMHFISPGSNVRGVTTIVLLILGLGSVQIIAISVIGDYIAKIIEEVKNRPKFIRKRIIYNSVVYNEEAEISKIIAKVKSGWQA
ncbi:MAG: NAD-dependent epimerase/dehydratase family protein [Elusimicrobiales bacterium]|nr:NAD-dependent epimerase/dehydratase family protein [Elusimicrobiales bacterium]